MVASSFSFGRIFFEKLSSGKWKMAQVGIRSQIEQNFGKRNSGEIQTIRKKLFSSKNASNDRKKNDRLLNYFEKNKEGKKYLKVYSFFVSSFFSFTSFIALSTQFSLILLLVIFFISVLSTL